MSEAQINAACLIAAGLGMLVMFFIARFYRKQNEKDEARRALLDEHVRAEMRRVK